MIGTAETIDASIRARGCFCLVNLEGDRIFVYKPGSTEDARLTHKIAERLSQNENEGMAKLRNFLLNQARLGK